MSQILPKDSFSTSFFFFFFLIQKKGVCFFFLNKTLQIYYLSNQYIFVDYFYFFGVRK